MKGRGTFYPRLGIRQGVRGPPEDREAAEEASEWRSSRREQGRFGHWPGPEAAAWEPIRVTFSCHEDVPIREAPRLPQAVLAASEHNVFSGVQSQAAGEKKGRLCSVHNSSIFCEIHNIHLTQGNSPGSLMLDGLSKQWCFLSSWEFKTHAVEMSFCCCWRKQNRTDFCETRIVFTVSWSSS